MPRGIYERKPRGDKPQAATGKAAKLPRKPAVKRAPRKPRATSSDGSLAAYVSDKAMLKDALRHFPGEVVDAEVRSRTYAVEVTPNVYGWLAINAKARGIGPDVLLEELVMRHIQLGLS